MMCLGKISYTSQFILRLKLGYIMISINFYGKISDFLGSSIRLELPQNNMKIETLRIHLSQVKNYPEIKDLSIRATVNDEFVSETYVVHSHDTVSFLSPFSGG